MCCIISIRIAGPVGFPFFFFSGLISTKVLAGQSTLGASIEPPKCGGIHLDVSEWRGKREATARLEIYILRHQQSRTGTN